MQIKKLRDGRKIGDVSVSQEHVPDVREGVTQAFENGFDEGPIEVGDVTVRPGEDSVYCVIETPDGDIDVAGKRVIFKMLQLL